MALHQRLVDYGSSAATSICRSNQENPVKPIATCSVATVRKTAHVDFGRAKQTS